MNNDPDFTPLTDPDRPWAIAKLAELVDLLTRMAELGVER